MSEETRNILITGYPGVGKTTLFVKLVKRLQKYNPVGFYTEEIREGGVRKGFRLVDIVGGEQILAHIDIKGRHRVGKYGVNVSAFESYLTKTYSRDSKYDFFMIDEIGKMECLSPVFNDFITGTLNSDRLFIATIAMKGPREIFEIKERDDIILFEITAANRDNLISEIMQHVPSI